MLPIHRRAVLAALILGPLTAHAQTESVVFHFYGAENCPPCILFKRAGLPVVQAAGTDSGFRVMENLIARTEDIGRTGVYGSADPLLRRAAAELDRVYPPIFIVTRGTRILYAREGDWRTALVVARNAAGGA